MRKLQQEGKVTKAELKNQMKSQKFWRSTMKTLLLIMFYYSTSIGLTFYQNWLMKELRFPLTIVLTHFIIKFLMASICRAAFTFHTGVERITLGWAALLGKVGLVSLVASLDIGLSQWSFEYIDVALYTITKSTSIVFILIFAICLKLEKKHWSLVLIVVTISVGLSMFTYKSTDFVLLGFLMVLSASFLSGIRWTVSQLILQTSTYGLSNPVDMIFHVQPLMIICLLPFAIGFEGARVSSSVLLFRFNDLSVLFETLGLVSVGGFIAFLMELGEFVLLAHTSSLTLSIAGIVKEIVSLVIAIVFQSNDISVINMIGLVVCVSGISLHVLRKATKEQRPERVLGSSLRRADSGEGGEPLLSSDSDMTDSETEIFHTTRSSRRGSMSRRTSSSRGQEDVFMRNHREWTTVRDSHIESLHNPEAAKEGIQLGESLANDTFVTDLVAEEKDGDVERDALIEADLLLSQLDLISSDTS